MTLSFWYESAFMDWFKSAIQMNHQSSINLLHSFWFNHQWSIPIWSMLSLGSWILSLSCSLQSITLFSFIDGAVVNSFFVYMKVIYHEIFNKMLNWWSLVNIAMMFVCQNQFEVVPKKLSKHFTSDFLLKGFWINILVQQIWRENGYFASLFGGLWPKTLRGWVNLMIYDS